MPDSQSKIHFNFHIADIFPILRKQRNVVFLFLATVLGTTLVGGLLADREYRATAIIHLLPRSGQEVKMSEVVDLNQHGYYEMMQFYRTQVQILKSRTVREEVVRRYEAMGYDDLTLAGGGAGALGGMVVVVPEEQSQLIDVHVTHTDPERAAILANLVARVYSDKNLDVRRESAREAKEWLEEKLAEYRKRLDESNRILYEFKAAHDMVDVEEQLTSLSARMNSMNHSYGDVSTLRVRLETKVSAHEEAMRRGDWAELAKVLESPLLRDLAQRHASARQERMDLSSRYGPKHPEIQRIDARIAEIEAAVRAEVKTSIDAERAELAEARNGERDLQREIDGLKAELLKFQEQRTQYDNLKYELLRSEDFYTKLGTRLDEVHLAARTQLNNVSIIDPAIAPNKPIKPNIPLSMIIALVVGAAGGVGLALLREYVDDTIGSHLDVANYLKVPFLGLIPSLPPGAAGPRQDLFTHDHPRSSVAEAVRGLRALIELNPSGVPPKRLLVTSSVAREGKTSTTVRLAVAYAQMGKRVLIIDADLRRPRVHKVFGQDNEVGLGTYLLGAAEVDDLYIATEVPNLFVLYSGPGTDHPVELMSSPRMQQLLGELDQRFDLVLLDTPPSVALSDAVSLSRFVDGILLVVKEQSVSRYVVKQTVDTLQQAGANILGVVLNNVDLAQGGSKYKYYYAYRDYYYNYAPESEKKPGAAAK